MDIKVKLEAQTDNFSQSIDAAIDQILNLASEVNASQAEIKKAFNELGKQSFEVGGAQSVEYFREQIVAVTKTIHDYQEQLTQLQASDTFDKNSDEVKELQENLADATKTLEQLKAAYDGADAAQLAQASENAKGMSQAFNALPGPIKNAVNGLKGLVNAAKAFIATPLGAVIAALVAAFGILKSYFTGTADGQKKLAQATAVLGSVFDSLKDVAMAIGRAIVNAFTRPKEAVKELWDVIKKNLMTRLEGFIQQFKAFGKILKSVFTLDWDGVKEGAKEYADAATKMVTGASVEQWKKGFDKAKDSMTEFAKKTAEAAQQMGLLKQRELDLRQARSKWQIKEAELDEKIAKSRMAAYDEDATAEERAKALGETQTLITQKYQQQIAFAKEELAITKKKNALHENTIEDYEKEDALQANINRLQAQMASEIASVERRRATAAKQAKEEEFKRGQEALSLEVQIGEKRLEMQDESLEKQMESIRLAKERKRLELQGQEHEWRAKQGGQLTDDQQKYIETVAQMIDDAADVEAHKVIFEKYASAAEKAIKQQKDFGNDIAYLESQGKDTSEAVRQQQNAALDYLTSDEAPVDQEFSRWIGSLVEYTADSLETMLLDAEKKLAVLESSGNASDEEIIKARAMVAALRKEMNSALKDDSRDPKVQKFKNLNKVLADSAKGFEALGQTGNEAFDNIMKDVSSFLGSVETIITNIQTLVEGSIKAMETSAQEGAAAVKAVEKASVILAIIGAVLQIALKIKDALKDTDQTAQMTAEVKKLFDALRQLKRDMALDVSANNSIFGENQYKNLQQYASAANTFADEYQKSLDKMAMAGMESARAYSKGNVQSGLFGWGGKKERESIDDFYDSIEAQMKQRNYGLNEAVQQMLSDTVIITQEKSLFKKQKTKQLSELLGDVKIIGETEEETIANLKKLVESDPTGKLRDEQKSDIENMIADWEAYQEALEGIKNTYANFFNGMTDAFADSIKTGFEEGAGAGRKSFAESVNGMVSDFYLSMKLGERLADMQDEYTQKMLDAKNADEKQNVVMEYADKLMDIYDDELDGYNQLQDQLEARGYGLKDTLDGTMSGAIKGASQESIDLLSGYCNAVRIQQVDGINIMRDQLISLSGIQQNTSNTNLILTAFKNSYERSINADSVRATGAVA